MRDTYLLGKVFVQNTEYKYNFLPLYLNYLHLNVILDEEDCEDDHNNDLEEDTTSVLEVPDQYEKVYMSHPYFKNKIGCIKDSYVPQKQSHT